jgi:hypothetical protein
MILKIPQIVIEPSLEDIQTNLTKTVTNAIDVHKLVTCWGQRQVAPVQPVKGDSGIPHILLLFSYSYFFSGSFIADFNLQYRYSITQDNKLCCW